MVAKINSLFEPYWPLKSRPIFFHGLAGKLLITTGGARDGVEVNWNVWHDLIKSSTFASMFWNHTLLLSNCFVFFRPRCDSCARSKIRVWSCLGITSLFPFKTKLSFTESSFLTWKYSFVFPCFCHLFVCRHFRTWVSNLSCSDAVFISCNVIATGRVLSVKPVIYCSVLLLSLLSNSLHLRVVDRDKISEGLKQPPLMYLTENV